MRHERAMPASAEACFRILVSEAYDAAVARRHGLREYRAVTREPRHGDWQRRVMHAAGRAPDALAPWLARLGIESSGELREEQWRSDAERCVHFRIEAPALGDRVRVTGEIRLEPVGEAACRRIVDSEVRVRIPLLGGPLERALARVLTEANDKSGDAMVELASQKPT